MDFPVGVRDLKFFQTNLICKMTKLRLTMSNILKVFWNYQKNHLKNSIMYKLVNNIINKEDRK